METQLVSGCEVIQLIKYIFFFFSVPIHPSHAIDKSPGQDAVLFKKSKVHTEHTQPAAIQLLSCKVPFTVIGGHEFMLH